MRPLMGWVMGGALMMGPLIGGALPGVLPAALPQAAPRIAAPQAASGQRNLPAGPRNVLLILADDLGWRDSSVYGSPSYQTPNLERLAHAGMKFTDAYAASPACSPTRASILTGKYPQRLGLTSTILSSRTGGETATPQPSFFPWARLAASPGIPHLPPGERTIAEAVKGGGPYRTCFLGKWHLGGEAWFPGTEGFDTSIAATAQSAPPSYFSPYHIPTLPDGPEGEYLTDRLTDEVIRYLRDHDRTQPFLLFLWHFSVHGPFQAEPALVQKCRERINPSFHQRNPVYAAMIQSLDESLGRILDALDELELASNTIVLFTSDNGGLIHDRAGLVTSNAPLRGEKTTLYEGGVRVPLVVRWPGVVPPGTECDQPVSSIDFYPTILEIAGVSEPGTAAVDGESLLPLLTQTGPLKRDALFWHFPHYFVRFVQKEPPPETPAAENDSGLPAPQPEELADIELVMTPASAVRKGSFKLIKFYEGPAFELYDLANDIGEQNNLASAMPDKVLELDTLLRRHIEEVGARVPDKNPRYVEGYTVQDMYRRVTRQKKNLDSDK
ncbi:MAG: sulfatase [Planctomycetota bacterium]